MQNAQTNIADSARSPLVIPYFQIIGQEEQVLQVALLANESFYINCEVLYGSETLYQDANRLGILRNMLLQPATKLTRLQNKKEQVEYFGLQKGKGKVLVLDVTQYKSLYVDVNRLVGLNFQYDITQVSASSLAGNLCCFEPLRPSANDFIFLQGDAGTICANTGTYIEKQLATGEKMMTSSSNILCFSKGMRSTNRSRSGVVLEGPGFVFMTSTPKQLFKYNTVLFVLVGYIMLELLVWLLLF